MFIEDNPGFLLSQPHIVFLISLIIIQMNSLLNSFDWPQGRDGTDNCYAKAGQRTPCWVTFDKNSSAKPVDCRATYILDSQQAYILLTVDSNGNQLRQAARNIVFAFGKYSIVAGLEGDNHAAANAIKKLRATCPAWFKDIKGKVSYAARDPATNILRVGNPHGYHRI
jgi:hypothetical protein